MHTRYVQRVVLTCTSIFLILGFLAGTIPLEARQQPLWPHEVSDLPPDPAVTYGVLPNGFRYAIMPNNEPAGQISMRILFQTGSLMETERQRGLAHFLEHMAFNGTTHYQAGEMVEYFQRLGMAFGTDANAFTNFENTVYHLELPNKSPELIRDSLQLLRDYADGILLSQEEIEKERGVILAEMRERDNWGYRTSVARLNFLIPDTLIVNRLIIGLEDVIRNATRQDFVDFYTRWYTPDRMVLVVVGEVQSETLLPLITEYFGDLESRKPVPDPDQGAAAIEGISAALHSEQDASVTQIELFTGRPLPTKPYTRARWITDLQLGIANSILSRRFDILAKKEEAHFLSGSAGSWEFFELLDASSIDITCQPNHWKTALSTAEQELRRALRFGFTRTEIEEQKVTLLNAFEEALRAASTRHSSGLAGTIISGIVQDDVFLSPETKLELVREAVDGLASDTILERFRQAWENEGVKIFISGDLELEQAEDRILAAYRQSQQVEVTPPEQQEVQTFAYTDFGIPGEITSRVEHDDLGITQIIFDNRVRLNLKPTDFQANSILFDVAFGSGFLSLPDDKPGLMILTEEVFISGGLQAHSLDDIQRIFAGKSVSANFGIGYDTFFLGGATTSEDLPDQLRLLCAYMVAPGYREEAFRMIQKTIDPFYIDLEHTIGGVIQSQIRPFLRGNDPRFGVPEKHELLARTLEEAAAWLEKPLKQNYLEISLVGDFKPEETIDLVAATFGALPQREETKPAFEEERKIRFPAGIQEKMFSYQTDTPQAEASVVWPTEDQSNITNVYHLRLLAAILEDRLRVNIREKMGEVYDAGAYNTSSQTFPGFGFMSASAIVDPEKVDMITAEIEKIADDLAEHGATQDEFERALAPVLSSLKESLEDNGFWLGYVSGSQEFPYYLDRARNIVQRYESASLDTVNALAKKYLHAERGIRIKIVPE